MKINSKIHGIIDYLVVLFLWLSPTIFQMQPYSEAFAYILGFVHFALSLATNYEPGVLKYIPLKIHGTIELIVAIALVGVAFYLGNLEGDFSRNYYLGFAIAVFVVWLLSDYTNKPFSKDGIPEIESNTDGGMI